MQKPEGGLIAVSQALPSFLEAEFLTGLELTDQARELQGQLPPPSCNET